MSLKRRWNIRVQIMVSFFVFLYTFLSGCPYVLPVLFLVLYRPSTQFNRKVLRMLRRITLSAFILMIGFAVFPIRTYATDELDTLSDVEKLYGLSLFWKEASYNFAFFDQVPDLDWDKTYREYIPKVLATESTAEYYKVLQRFCALLKDGHTNVYPPSSIRQAQDFPQVAVRNIQHQAVVVNVGVSLEKIIPLGSEIIYVDKMPTEEFLKKHIFPFISSSTDHILWDWGIKDMLAGPPNTQIQVRIRTPEGTIRSVTLSRNEQTAGEPWIREEKDDEGPVEFKLLGNGIGYLALNGFGRRTAQKFKEVLPKLYVCEGVILDLRGNGGGSDSVAWEIIGFFTDKPFLGPKWKTPEHRAAFKAWDRGIAWYEDGPQRKVPPDGRKVTVPMVILTGHETASSAENFLVCIDSIKRATTVGQRTFGSTGQPLDFELPGGGKARICTKRNTYPDGRDIVGVGIIPDIEVNPTKEDRISGRDIVLEKALDVLKEQM